jgi:rhomboid protease GluP
MNNEFKSNSQKYRITFALIILNIAIYTYTSIVGGSFFITSENVVWKYGQVNGLILYYGYYYQLFTAMFIHGGLVHIAGNILFLLVFGLRGEEMFSLPEYLGIYIIGGLAGNVLSLIVGPDFVSVGASGAIFAMFGACAIYARRSIGQSIVGALIYGFFLLMISSGENVNVLAHIGGLVAGLAFGYLLARRRRVQTAYKASCTYMTPF